MDGPSQVLRLQKAESTAEKMSWEPGQTSTAGFESHRLIMLSQLCEKSAMKSRFYIMLLSQAE